MTKTFMVTVEFTGTKTYIIDAKDEAEVVKMFESYGSFDHVTNPDDDSVSEDIVSVSEMNEED